MRLFLFIFNNKQHSVTTDAIRAGEIRKRLEPDEKEFTYILESEYNARLADLTAAHASLDYQRATIKSLTEELDAKYPSEPLPLII